MKTTVDLNGVALCTGGEHHFHKGEQKSDMFSAVLWCEPFRVFNPKLSYIKTPAEQFLFEESDHQLREYVEEALHFFAGEGQWEVGPSDAVTTPGIFFKTDKGARDFKKWLYGELRPFPVTRANK